MDENNGTADRITAKSSKRGVSRLFPPLILIAVGVLLLVQKFGGWRLENWWALFILLPALSAFGGAIRLYEQSGRVNFAVLSTFYGGLFPLLVAIMFLFELDWGLYWPLFVILPGVSMIINSLPVRRTDVKHVELLALHRPWLFWTGVSATLLGFAFLFDNLNMLDIETLLPAENWWAYFVMLPAVGGVFTVLRILIKKAPPFLLVINLVGTLILVLVASIPLLNLSWNLMNYVVPSVFILVGLGTLLGLFNVKKDKDAEPPKSEIE